MVSSNLHPEATTAPSPRTPLSTSIRIDLDMESPAGSPSHSRAHARSRSWCAPSAIRESGTKSPGLSPEMLSVEFVDSFDIVKTPLRRVPKKRPTTRGKKRTADDHPVSPRHGRSSRSRSKSKSISPKHSMEVIKEHVVQDSSMSLESEYLATPAPPTTELKRRIAPLRSSRSSLFGIASTSIPSPIQAYAYRDKAPSRDSSPVPGARNDSSPLKKPRTSLSGEIINFHYSSDSDSDSDTPSPTMRSRARFNQLLGPSPLQKSFSSSASPPTPCGSLQKSVSASLIPKRPPRTPFSAAGAQTLDVPFKSDRSSSTPTIPTSGGLQIPSGALSPNGDILSPLKVRSKILSEVEGLETELNKVFALVHGKGLGLGAGGRGRRSVSGLRQSKAMDDADGAVEDGSPAPRRRGDSVRREGEDMEVDGGG